MKKLIGAITLCLFIAFQTVTVDGAENTTSPEADYLNALGLLRGTVEGYELDATMSRVQGSVMIVRLLGKEQHALAANNDHPFTDVPSWADPYVGYMYRSSLTTGQSDVLFGAADLMTQAQYLTFILRALGYKDQAGDFYWADAVLKAQEIGLMDNKILQSSTHAFYRDVMVKVTFNALKTKLKDEAYSLEAYLDKQGVLPPTLATAKLIYGFETDAYVKSPVTIKQLSGNLSKMIYELETERSFDVSKLSSVDLAAALEPAMTQMASLPGYSSVLSKYNMTSDGKELTVTMDFNITADQLAKAKDKAYAVVASEIKAEMNAFEKELAIHDYIVDHVAYDTSKVIRPASYTLYGALVEGSAVCHGYAESFHLLAYLAGLDSDIIFGEAVSDGVTIGHAWNLITMDGETYHVDTTWDDPVMSDGTNVLSYSYFNLNDEAISQDHQWDSSVYEASDATAYNYYVYMKQVVYSKSQLQAYIQNAFNEGMDNFSVKLSGVELTASDVKAILQSCYGYGQITYRLDSDNNVVVIASIG